MSPERWRKIEELYHAAQERAPNERGAFLAGACRGDDELEREVEVLLAQDSDGHILDGAASRALAPSVGDRLGHYEIVALVGAGGMGEVYKARDPRLQRDVALKVLPTEVSGDPARRRRFAQEARAASALNHPHIITIYEIGESGGIDFIAMEFVSGKTLGQLIPRRGMRLGEVLKYSIEIADALAAAHAARIVHRDLKPGNVMVSENGSVKVLDFGLATTAEMGASSEFQRTETIVDRPLTEQGMILGTVSYMSPEQAQGKKLDARSDIFAFGALLYEMLTGRRAFQGDSKMATLAAILSQEPEPVEGIPPELVRILQRCLRKEPERRAQSILDLKLALEELKEELKEETQTGKLAAAAARARKSRKLKWVPALLLLPALGGTAYWLTLKKPMALLQVVPLTTYPGYEDSASFSPYGNQLAFSWNGEKGDNYDVYVTLIGSGGLLRLTTDPANDMSPAWSPDGRSIAFVRAHNGGKAEIVLIPALGGSERPVAEFPTGASRPSWSPDGRWLVISTRDPPEKPPAVFMVSVETGEKRQLTLPPLTASDRGDQSGTISPDGGTLAFVRLIAGTASDIYLRSLGGDLTPRGEPRRLTSDNREIAGIAWSADSREIIFSSDRGGTTRALWEIAVSGGESRRIAVGENGQNPSISAKGNRLVYTLPYSDEKIWRVNLSDPRQPPARFIASTRREIGAQYSPDGKKIAFVSDRSGNEEVWVCDADGANPVELVVTGRSGNPNWSPDSQRIAFGSDVDGRTQVFTVSAYGGRPQRIVKSPSNDSEPSWSHDGKWIYFNSNRSGILQVWKVPFNGGEAVQITQNGGFGPLESEDGRTIYYKRPGKGPLLKVPVEGGEETRILDSVRNRAFVVTHAGIYYVTGRELRCLSFDTGKSKLILTFEKPVIDRLSVSPDEHWLLYTQVERGGSDLMLVENFR